MVVPRKRARTRMQFSRSRASLKFCSAAPVPLFGVHCFITLEGGALHCLHPLCFAWPEHLRLSFSLSLFRFSLRGCFSSIRSYARASALGKFALLARKRRAVKKLLVGVFFLPLSVYLLTPFFDARDFFSVKHDGKNVFTNDAFIL